MKYKTGLMFSFFLLSFVFVNTACAKKDIKGIIQDAAGQPIAGIEVRIRDSDFEMVTKKDGSFKLPFVEGNIRLVFYSNNIPDWCKLKDFVKNSVTKERYPKGLDIGIITIRGRLIKLSDGKTVWASYDGRFIEDGNGTVTDTKTGLMWAAVDNGRDINWADAKKYCENYQGAGCSDWRMPTLYELAGLHKKPPDGIPVPYMIKLSKEIVWSSNINKRWPNVAESFDFFYGRNYPKAMSKTFGYRALPVREVN